MRITVLGAGAWGTALAVAASRRHDVVLWARDAQQASAMARQRVNERYLPGVDLPPALSVCADRAIAVNHAGDRAALTLVATPMSQLRSILSLLPAGRDVVWLCKGFERSGGLLGHEIAQQVCPHAACAVLSGPSFAVEVARGQATALVAAGSDERLLAHVVDALHGDALRVYTSADIIGVEVGGAVKNVLAIATGIVDGLGAEGGQRAPGLNARAALITRGLAEMTRLGVALGARAETFMGLSGLGDLVLTATGAMSRNRQVGLRLAEGLSLRETLEQLGHVAEGVHSAPTVVERAHRCGVEMPIAEAVVDVLEERITPADAILRLMSRQARPEGH